MSIIPVYILITIIIANIKKERGEFDGERKTKLEKEIQENLRKGNFKIQKNRRKSR